MAAELTINTLSVGNDLNAKNVRSEDIHVNGISVKECIEALSILSNSVDIDTGGQSYRLVGTEI